MRTTEYPRLQEQCTETVLPCGLTVRVLHKPLFDKCYAVLAVRYGAVDTEFTLDGRQHRTPPGVAHYLEHRMFDLPGRNVTQEFNLLGGNPNAFTAYDMTAYFVQSTDHAEENLRLLLEMVLTPCFSAESVEKERGIIAEEIRMYADNADTQVYERLVAEMYPEHPIRIPIAGTLESIEEITVDTLQTCYDAFYRPANMILCVEGKLSAETVFGIAGEVCGSRRSPAGRPVVQTGRQRAHHAATTAQMDVAMPKLCAALPLPELAPGDAKTEIAAELACELVAGEASACYQRLYEQGRIDPSFYIGFESIRSLAMLTLGGDTEEPEEVLDAVFDEAKRLLTEGIDRTEFLRLKRSAIGRRMRDLDSFPATCNRICTYFFEQLEYLDFPAVFDTVSEDDVMEILRRFDKSRVCVSLIEPREEKEEET